MKINASALIDLTCLVSGATLLSITFGWPVGVGITALVYFHKSWQQ